MLFLGPSESPRRADGRVRDDRRALEDLPQAARRPLPAARLAPVPLDPDATVAGQPAAAPAVSAAAERAGDPGGLRPAARPVHAAELAHRRAPRSSSTPSAAPSSIFALRRGPGHRRRARAARRRPADGDRSARCSGPRKERAESPTRGVRVLARRQEAGCGSPSTRCTLGGFALHDATCVRIEPDAAGRAAWPSAAAVVRRPGRVRAIAIRRSSASCAYTRENLRPPSRSSRPATRSCRRPTRSCRLQRGAAEHQRGAALGQRGAVHRQRRVPAEDRRAHASSPPTWRTCCDGTDVGTVFLDRDLSIRKFTPAIAEVFNLLPQDVGRPLEAHLEQHPDRAPRPDRHDRADVADAAE